MSEALAVGEALTTGTIPAGIISLTPRAIGAIGTFFLTFFFDAPTRPGGPPGHQGVGKGAATRRVVEDLALARVRRPRVAPARDRVARYDGRHAFGGKKKMKKKSHNGPRGQN